MCLKVVLIAENMRSVHQFNTQKSYFFNSAIRRKRAALGYKVDSDIECFWHFIRCLFSPLMPVSFSGRMEIPREQLLTMSSPLNVWFDNRNEFMKVWIRLQIMFSPGKIKLVRGLSSEKRTSVSCSQFWILRVTCLDPYSAISIYTLLKVRTLKK